MTTAQLIVLLRSAPKLEQLSIKFARSDVDDGLIDPADETLNNLLNDLKKRGCEVIIDGLDHGVVESGVLASQSSNTGVREKASHEKKDVKHQKKSTRRLRQHQETEVLDANTKHDPETQFDVIKIFESKGKKFDDLKIPLYRLNIYDDFDVNEKKCNVDNAFFLKSSPPSDIQAIVIQAKTHSLADIFESKKDNQNKIHYRAKSKCIINQNWQPLPSISPEEKITDWHVEPSGSYELGFSVEKNLHYIRKKVGAESEVSIDFIVEVPAKSATPETVEGLPKEINDIVAICRGFSDDALIVPENPTGMDYIRALEDQKKGVCRHRALLFMHLVKEMDKNNPPQKTSVRYVSNDCHAFAEIKCGDKWITCNLGGAEARLNFLENSDRQTGVRPTPEEMLRAELMTQVLEGANEDVLTKALATEYFPKRKSPEQIPLPDFISSVIGLDKSKHLLEIQSSQVLGAMAYELQRVCKRMDRPVFYVNHPDELICASPIVKPSASDPTKGAIHDGPAGRLYKFLEECRVSALKPVLIINFDNFKAADFVKYNSMLDQDRKVDGIPIPSNVQILGLINPSRPNAYHDSSFYSRFGQNVETVSYTESDMVLEKPFEIADPEGAAPNTTLNCYGSKDWKDHLLGAWQLDGTDLCFRKGKLFEAIERSNTSIELLNPPRNEEFEYFWRQAKLNGKIEHEGFELDLPTNLNLSVTRNARLSSETSVQLQAGALPEEIYPLNEVLFPQFLHHDTIEGRRLKISQGIFEEKKHNTINVYLTHEMRRQTWSWFLDEAEKNNVKINLYVAPGVRIPSALGELPPPTRSAIPDDKNEYIKTNDRDVTLTNIKKSDSSAILIDISELTANDLLTFRDGSFNKETKQFSFSEKRGVVKKLLDEGETVVLHGDFDPILQQDLAALLLERRAPSVLGKLVLISEKDLPFSDLCKVSEQKISNNDKKACLKQQEIDILNAAFPGPKPNDLDSLIDRHTLSELQAIARKEMAREKYHSSEPLVEDRAALDAPESSENTRNTLTFFDTRRSQHAFMGHREAPKESRQVEIDYNNLDDAAAKTKVFNQERLTKVESFLKKSPFVYLGGISGVGKTTFIDTVYAKEIGGSIYKGEDKIVDWANDRSPGRKTLFIDEANISQRHWSQFEGLFDDPVHIVVNGELIPLTDEHKVIFASNPASYSSDRQVPEFLARHGNSVWFKPLPPAYLYHEILKPILPMEFSEEDQQTISKPILAVASYLTKCARDEVLITPRELKMMANLTVLYCKNNPSADKSAVAKYYAYQLALNLVPETHRADFKEKYFPEWSPDRKVTLTPVEGKPPFVLTDTNRPTAIMLDNFLNLRKHHLDNPSLKPAGLGGITIEGEPGLGKSEIAVQLLQAHNLTEGDPNSADLDQNHFYKIPSTWSLEEREKFLKKAFHAGVIIIWDEINSASSSERLLNDLLLGQLEGRPANNPGFMLIGTQNPPTMAGRRETSPAMLHRMHYRILPPYSAPEMLDILWSKGLPEKIAESMIREYQQKKENQQLCFRDLIACADKKIQTLTEQEKAQHQLERSILNEPSEVKEETIGKLGDFILQKLINKDNISSSVLAVVAKKSTNPLILAQITEKHADKPAIAKQLVENVYTSSTSLLKLAENSESDDFLITVLKHPSCTDEIRNNIFERKNQNTEIVKIVAEFAKDDGLLSKIINKYPDNIDISRKILSNRQVSISVLELLSKKNKDHDILISIINHPRTTDEIREIIFNHYCYNYNDNPDILKAILLTARDSQLLKEAADRWARHGAQKELFGEYSYQYALLTKKHPKEIPINHIVKEANEKPDSDVGKAWEEVKYNRLKKVLDEKPEVPSSNVEHKILNKDRSVLSVVKTDNKILYKAFVEKYKIVCEQDTFSMFRGNLVDRIQKREREMVLKGQVLSYDEKMKMVLEHISKNKGNRVELALERAYGSLNKEPNYGRSLFFTSRNPTPAAQEAKTQSGIEIPGRFGKR